MRLFFCDRLPPNPRFSCFKKSKLPHIIGQNQELEIIDRAEFGKTMSLPRNIQFLEENEFLHYEPMAHPLLNTHLNPPAMCVIDADDRGIMREILCPHQVNCIHPELGELEKVIRHSVSQAIARNTCLPEISPDDTKVLCYRPKLEDGRAFIAETGDIFDVVIMDMTDPLGPSTMQCTQEYFQAIKDRLCDKHSFLVTYCESRSNLPLAKQPLRKTLNQVYTYQHQVHIAVQKSSTTYSIIISSDNPEIAHISSLEIYNYLKEKQTSGPKTSTSAVHHVMHIEYPHAKDIHKGFADLPAITDAALQFVDKYADLVADVPHHHQER